MKRNKSNSIQLISDYFENISALAGRYHFETAFYLSLILLLVALLWLSPINRGLWLDETGTYWMIKDGFSQIAPRCIQWPSTSALYSAIVLLSTKLAGMNEIAMRIPSVLAAAVAAFLVYRLSLLLFGRRAGLPSVLVFVGLEPIAFAACDARAYAFAILSALAAVFTLIRWLQTFRIVYGVVFCLFASLTIYFHLLFAAMLLVYAVYAVYCLRAGKRPVLRSFIIGCALIGLFSLPLIPFALSLVRSGSKLVFVPTPGLITLFAFILPPVTICPLLAGVAFFYSTNRPFRWIHARMEQKALVLIAFWLLLPPLLFFVVSVLTPEKIFIPRYLLPCLGALALLAGWVISLLDLPSRVLCAVLIASLAILPNKGFRPAHGGDWRAAIENARTSAVASGMPVLIRSGFPESVRFGDWSKAQYIPFLFAPLEAYPLSANFVRLPYYLTPEAAAHLEQASPSIENAKGFMLITMGEPEYDLWLQGRFSPAGFEAQPAKQFAGTLRTILFLKRRGR